MSPHTRRVCAYAFASMMVCAALLHAYWALGGAWFLHEASGGEIEPGAPLSFGMRIATWGLVAAMGLASLLALGRVELIARKIPQWFYALSCWVTAVCMFLGALLNFSIPRPWDRFVFAPIFVLLGVLISIVAWPQGIGLGAYGRFRRLMRLNEGGV